MSAWKPAKITPSQIIILGFLVLIAVGTVLLMLPVSSREPGGASILDALFTATSATCVTGLVVRDTAMYWSPFGQAVILLLLQIGGMGVVTMGMAIFMFSGRKISLKQRWVMQESIAAPQVGGIIRQTRFLLTGSLLIEVIGAALLAIRFCGQLGFGKGLWYAVFHSISAFCNAGFDLMGTVRGAEFSSLTGYTFDPLVNVTACLLIVVGGLGFLTWRDIREHGRHLRSYRLQSKLILSTTAILLVLGFLYFFFYEFRQPQWAAMSEGQRLMAAAFQSVTPRTAGFNTVDLRSLSQSGTLLTMILMFIGAGSGSTGGGIKVNTFAVLMLSALARVRRREDVDLFGRRLDEEDIHKAFSAVSMYFMVCIAGCMVLCLQGIALDDALFESISAMGTVGLTRGITATLPAFSKVTVTLMMFAGRVGSMSVAMAITRDRPRARLRNVPEKILIG